MVCVEEGKITIVEAEVYKQHSSQLEYHITSPEMVSLCRSILKSQSNIYNRAF